MTITFLIPSPLRSFTEGKSQVEITAPAKTVGEALGYLWKQYPGLRDRIVNEQGAVREHLNVFVGEENIRSTGGLETAVPDGSKISIVPAVSGGVISGARSG
ncbi:MAG: MoaD family protein [Acidobacteria bacterium]|nr:MoaD family protein [Acidobacteriota bacterium]